MFCCWIVRTMPEENYSGEIALQLGTVLRILIYIPGIPNKSRMTFPARESRGFGFCFSFACCRSNILRTVRTKRVPRDIK
jgi:hypothetical protein